MSPVTIHVLGEKEEMRIRIDASSIVAASYNDQARWKSFAKDFCASTSEVSRFEKLSACLFRGEKSIIVLTPPVLVYREAKGGK